MQSTSQKPVVVFDLDGTLADTILDLVPAVNRTIQMHGLTPVSPARIGHVTATGLKSMIEFAYQLNNRVVPPALLDELFTVCVADYSDNLCVNTVVFPGVEACLQRFAENDWLLAVCTNKPVGLAVELLRELGIHDKFAAITGGDSYPYKKPDPRHLQDTILAAGGRKTKAVMVGDTITDILAAQNAKMPVVAVDFGYSKEHVSQYQPQHVISHFDELFDAASTLIAQTK